ncbi:MAG: hypothetical protein AB1750_09390 [Chloroflexota bacterium]
MAARRLPCHNLFVMFRYRPAGQEFDFPCPVPELEPFAANGAASPSREDTFVPPTFPENEIGASLAPSRQTVGWVGDAFRRVQTRAGQAGILLQVDGGVPFHVSAGGKQIACANPSALTDLDREILVGPALVLALALRGVWSLHASAVLLDGRALLILGETGQGKSTLAAHLAQSHPRVADDILPVTIEDTGLTAWPRFPQLKLPLDSQPGAALPESIPAGWICRLAPTDPASDPALDRLSSSQATQTLLRHTAGTRLFETDLLARHLDFCARAAQTVPVYALTYPHRRDALPQVQELLLQALCSP